MKLIFFLTFKMENIPKWMRREYSDNEWPLIESFLIDKINDNTISIFNLICAEKIIVYHNYHLYMENSKNISKKQYEFLLKCLEYLIQTYYEDEYDRILTIEEYPQFVNYYLDILEKDNKLDYALERADEHYYIKLLPYVLERLSVEKVINYLEHTDRNNIDIKTVKRIINYVNELKIENESLKLLPEGIEYQKAKERFEKMTSF